MSYKYCIVPKCKNTTVTTPKKLFFTVPRHADIREKWYEAMKRCNKAPYSIKSQIFCCEDHFDVETDLENYMQYKLMGGGKLILRKGVMPHKFACQEIVIEYPVEIPGYRKRLRAESDMGKANPMEIPGYGKIQGVDSDMDKENPIEIVGYGEIQKNYPNTGNVNSVEIPGYVQIQRVYSNTSNENTKEIPDMDKENPKEIPEYGNIQSVYSDMGHENSMEIPEYGPIQRYYSVMANENPIVIPGYGKIQNVYSGTDNEDLIEIPGYGKIQRVYSDMGNENPIQIPGYGKIQRVYSDTINENPIQIPSDTINEIPIEIPGYGKIQRVYFGSGKMPGSINCPKRRSIGVQVNIKMYKFRSKATNTDDLITKFRKITRTKKRSRKPELSHCTFSDNKKSKSKSWNEWQQTKNGTGITKYGPCRCCLKKDLYTVENVQDLLECLNIEVLPLPGVFMLMCKDCSTFLLQVKRYRDMVAASQSVLLAAARTHDLHNVGVLAEYRDDPHLDIKEEIDEKPYLPDLLSDIENEQDDTTSDNLSDPSSDSENEQVKPTSDSEYEQDETTSDSEIELDETNAAILEVLKTDDTDNIPSAERIRKLAETRTNAVMKAELNLQIRENLSTLLQYSTVVPFTTKGDRYECIYCAKRGRSKNYSRFEKLRNHTKLEHYENEYEFRLKALKRLRELILRVDVSLIKYRLCDEQFTTIDSLVRHLVRVHDKKYHNIDRDPPHNVLCFNMSLDVFKCLYCAKIFKAFKGLLMHMKEHYGSYLCPKCGSKFIFESSYKTHLDIHVVHKKGRDSPFMASLNAV